MSRVRGRLRGKLNASLAAEPKSVRRTQRRAAQRGGQPPEKDVRKLRSKGWSDAKIHRWLASKGPRQDRTSQHDLLTRDQWMAFFDEALLLPSCEFIGIIMHGYKRSTDDEELMIAGRISTSTEVLRARNDPWKEDVLYEVRRQRAA